MNVRIIILLLLGATAFASASPPSLLPVPDVRQSTTWTCGAAALQAVLAYYGVEYREGQLVELCGTSPEHGTPPEAILKVARAEGFQAKLRENLELADLARALQERQPVIVALQAWRDQTERPWSQEWDSGHYVVVIGLDRQNVYFEDPSLLGSRGYIRREEFEQRWHDIDGAGRRYIRMGIFLQGRTPSPPPELAPISCIFSDNFL